MATRPQTGAQPVAPPLPDRYRIRRHLATGGMAAVWCAEDTVLGRTVAIKILAERFLDDEVAKRRFKREARAAARVSNHAHVVTIFDVGDLDEETGHAGGERPRSSRPSIGRRNGHDDDLGRPFMVMEYLAGGTVADALRVGAVRRQEAVRWLREAASALDHAHARGIVHRDIKPANFMLNRSRVLHVADFGIARLVAEDTITTAGELFGTAAYLSPEQALGRDATGASDRYALAVAAFELLTGERPFSAQHFAAQARQHIEDPVPAISERDRTLPQALDAVLYRGMAKEPEDRFGTAGDFVSAVETSLTGGIPMSGIPTTERAAPPPRRRTAPTTRPAAAAVAAAAASAATSTTGRLRQPTTGSHRVSEWTAADSIQRGSRGPRRAGRVMALAAILLAVVVVGAIAAGLGGPGTPQKSARSQTRPQTTAATLSHPATHKAKHVAKPTQTTTTTSSTATAPPSADQLQATGYQEMLAGNYSAAIPTLRKAISAADPHSLTYAYGLYNLGKSLLLSGDASDAVPVLEQRAKIPNQLPVVMQTLNQALTKSGQPPVNGAGATAQSGGAGITSSKKKPSSGGAATPAGGGAQEHPNIATA